MSICSLESASSCTRPCCMRRLLKCLRASKVLRLLSLFMLRLLVGDLLGDVEDAGLQTEAQIFVEACAQMFLALRFVEIVESADRGFVVGAATDLARTERAQLTVARVIEARRDEARPNQRRIRFRLTMITNGNLRAWRKIREARAAFLTPLGEHGRDKDFLLSFASKRRKKDCVR